MANGKPSQASVGSSPGPDQSFFLPFLQNFELLLCKKVRENVLKRFCVHSTYRKWLKTDKNERKTNGKRTKNGRKTSFFVHFCNSAMQNDPENVFSAYYTPPVQL